MTRPLNFESLESAVAQLRTGLEIASQEPANEMYRDAAIKRFEYTIDLAWKLLQRYLVEVTEVDPDLILTKRDLFRLAAQRGLIADAEQWIAYYKARNLSSHSYGGIVADTVYESAAGAADAVHALLEKLRDATRSTS